MRIGGYYRRGEQVITRRGRWVLLERQSLPIRGVSGVYVILDSTGVAVYVGSAVDLRLRLRMHHLPRPGLRVKVKASKRFGDFLMWEARLIRRLKPAGNYTFNPERKRAIAYPAPVN